MSDPFIENEWESLCRRLRRCAEFIGSRAPELAETFQRQADQFRHLNAPAGYRDLLDRVRSAATLANGWREQCRPDEMEGVVAPAPDIVEEAGDESFPASDPPAWTTTAI